MNQRLAIEENSGQQDRSPPNDRNPEYSPPRGDYSPSRDRSRSRQNSSSSLPSGNVRDPRDVPGPSRYAVGPNRTQQRGMGHGIGYVAGARRGPITPPPPLRRPFAIPGDQSRPIEIQGNQSRPIENQGARRRPQNPENLADELIREIRTINRRNREQNRFRPVNENPIVDHPQGDGPPPGGRRNPVLAVPDPLGELTYQMAQMTTEMRNLRDTMTGLRTSVQENSDFTEQLADSNEQLISEMNDRDDR